MEIKECRELIKSRILKFKEDEIFEFCMLNGFSERKEFINTIDILSLGRDLVNKEKGIKKISKYMRKREDLINFQSIISEYAISIFLYKLFNNSRIIDIKASSIVQVFVDKEAEDLQFFIDDKVFNVDTKSQFCFKSNFTVNVEAHERFLNHKCDGYLLALINCKSKKFFKEVNNIRYIFISTSYFEKNKVYVDLKKEDSSPFFSLSIKNILKDLK